MNGKKNSIIALTRYEGLMRELAKAVTEDDAEPDVFAKMAGIMAPWIPDGSVVVPMPGRDGMPLWSHKLVKEIVKVNPRVYYAGDFLRCDVHGPRKGVGGTRGEPPRMWVDEGFIVSVESAPGATLLEVPKADIFVIDNVVASGGTACSALRAVMDWQSRRVEASLYESGAVSCHVLALCRSSLRMV